MSETPQQRTLWDGQLEDEGPLLLTMLLNNNNNNASNNPNNGGPGTLDPRSLAMEVKPSVTRTSLCSTVVETNTNRPPLILRLQATEADSRSGLLTAAQLKFWLQNGFLVVSDALSQNTVKALLLEVHQTAEKISKRGEDVAMHSYLPGKQSYVSPMGRAIVSLTNQAFKPDIAPIQFIERIGCGVHQVLPYFRQAIFSQLHQELATSLGYKDPRIVQSQVIIKAAEFGMKIDPHQDGVVSFTDPPSCTTFWYALEDSSAENGCLAVVPGSHRSQPIRKRCRDTGNKRTDFVTLDEPVFATTTATAATVGDDRSGAMTEITEKLEFTKLEVPAGSLVLMHGNLVHTSEANKSARSRVAFNFNIVEGTIPWLSDNYLQPYEEDAEFEKLRQI